MKARSPCTRRSGTQCCLVRWREVGLSETELVGFY